MSYNTEERTYPRCFCEALFQANHIHHGGNLPFRCVKARGSVQTRPRASFNQGDMT